MGADGNSITKCGEILIHLKTKNKKAKIYQFNCAFCNINYEQLKKFSQHLEKTHLHQLAEEPSDATIICESKPNIELTEDVSDDKPDIYVPEIKIDEIISDTADELHRKLRKRKKEDPLKASLCRTAPTTVNIADDMESNLINSTNEDPLGTCINVTAPLTDEIIYKDVKSENEELEYGESSICNYDLLDDIIAVKKDIRKRKNRLSQYKRKDLDDDFCTDDSKDSDFNLEKELNKVKRAKYPTKPKKTPLKPKIECVVNDIPTTIDEKELSIALLQAFEKQTILWDVKNRTSAKEKIQKSYEIITEEVNEKFKTNIKWELARRTIRQMRHDYSVELEKQRKEKPFEMPWYSEHMKYLQENLDVLLKGRYEVSKYKALKTMDEKELSILIELYKKNEVLWQVNNVEFGIKSKKDESFDKIHKELKENYKINITEEYLYRQFKYMHRLYSQDKERELKSQREFIPSSPFYKQMSFLSESQGPFKCPDCIAIISSYKNYKVHVAKHKNIMPFQCLLCEMGFRKFSQYILHTKRHLGINNYNCTICGKGYPVKTEFEFHLRSHTGNKPFLCQICGNGFKNLQAYSNHVRRHEKRFRFECNICKRGFNYPQVYKAHMNMHLNIRDFVCTTCGKGFTTKYYLKRHELKHKH